MFGNDNGGIGPPTADRYFTLKKCEIALFCRSAWDLFYDLEVIYGLAKHLPKDDVRAAEALFVGNQIVNSVWPQDANENDYKRGREIARKFLSQKNGDGQTEVSVIGHCHIDTAWLWPYRETRRKTARSFTTAMTYMEDSDYPFYHFCCSQAQQLEWLKADYPAVFARLREKSNFLLLFFSIFFQKLLPKGPKWYLPRHRRHMDRDGLQYTLW